MATIANVPDPEELPEHVRANRAAWDGFAHEFVEPGHQNWATADAPERRSSRGRGYSPITLQMKPIEMKKPLNRAMMPNPP